MCSGCAPRSSAIPSVRRSSSRCAGSATRRVRREGHPRNGPKGSRVRPAMNGFGGPAAGGTTGVPLPFHVVRPSLIQRLRRIGRRAVKRWRRSIQIRVVSSTFVVSAIVVALLGLVVLEQVKSGLLQAKVRSSTNEVLIGRGTAQQYLSEGTGINALLTTVKTLSSQQPRRQAGSYEVVGYMELTPGKAWLSQPAKSVDFAASSLPTKLIDAVGSGDAQYYYAYTTMSFTDGSRYPGLAVGTAISSGSENIQLYYVFSLQQE